MKFNLSQIFCLLFFCIACQQEQNNNQTDFSKVTANEDVANYMAQFEGRGNQGDDSQPLTPEESLTKFNIPNDLSIQLLASEPLINQPVELNFDQQGRTWVVQYQQYPYPAGLKVTGVDWHLRLQFDTIPTAPPFGEKGADKITLLEDTNGDGQFDKATDAITGLNIVTGVTWGRNQIWVLNPPYLLSYPDPDGDGFPDGDPRVHLEGFGLEDTHAVANSLRWGPDGWLYGAQGSTTTATINSSVTKDVHFKGQGIWRYHPSTEIFELFAEGGGNTFHVEIDDKGRIYSGTNAGSSRGMYYKQGSYNKKNWGKHGALTNPYAFGFFPHMPLEGKSLRFVHAFLRYGGNGLSSNYKDALIGINPLHNFLLLGRFSQEGSNFKTIDESRMLTSDDHWFRPVDIKAGPDGGVYLADWYDSRLSHVSPLDTWHKTSGRIYKLTAQNAKPFSPTDFSNLSIDELIEMLEHPNRWHRQQAQRQFGDRVDSAAIPELKKLLINNTGQLALEGLWALHLSGGFNEAMAKEALTHNDPYVRMWAVRLLGDQRKISDDLTAHLVRLAKKEKHPEVKSQLASSAKRLPPNNALPIIETLMQNDDDQDDPHIPLLVWWALENKVASNSQAIINLFQKTQLWKHSMVQQTILERLIQRLIMEGGESNFQASAKLLSLAPSAELARPLLTGLEEGLRGKEITELSYDLMQAVQKLQTALGESSLDLALRNQQAEAITKALQIIADPKADRLNESSGALRQAAIRSLQSYQADSIGTRIINWYPDLLRADIDVRDAAQELLLSRSRWASYLLDAITRSKKIAASDIPLQMVRQLLLFENEDLSTKAKDIWPALRLLTADEKRESINRIAQVVKNKKGDVQKGKALYYGLCGACHQLNNIGGAIGPDLTGYDRSNLNYLLQNTIDPNAAIREGHVNFLVATKDGQQQSGILVDQSGGLIRLRNFNGSEITIAENQVEKMRAQAQSLMPERLLDHLTDEQLKDLFAYLMKQ